MFLGRKECLSPYPKQRLVEFLAEVVVFVVVVVMTDLAQTDRLVVIVLDKQLVHVFPLPDVVVGLHLVQQVSTLSFHLLVVDDTSPGIQGDDVSF